MAKNLTTELIQQVLANQTTTTTAVAAATTSINALSEKVEEMHHRLFGNGQPGVLHFLNKEIEKVDGKVDSNQKALEDAQKCANDETQKIKNKIIWVSGASSGAGAVIGIIGKYLLGKVGWHF